MRSAECFSASKDRETASRPSIRNEAGVLRVIHDEAVCLPDMDKCGYHSTCRVIIYAANTALRNTSVVMIADICACVCACGVCYAAAFSDAVCVSGLSVIKCALYSAFLSSLTPLETC